MDAETIALIESTARHAAKEAVAGTLTSLGIDASNPIDTQHDMAALRELRTLVEDVEFQKDMLHIRKWRMTLDRVQAKGVITLVGLMIVAFAGVAWLGIQQLIINKGG